MVNYVQHLLLATKLNLKYVCRNTKRVWDLWRIWMRLKAFLLILLVFHQWLLSKRVTWGIVDILIKLCVAFHQSLKLVQDYSNQNQMFHSKPFSALLNIIIWNCPFKPTSPIHVLGIYHCSFKNGGLVDISKVI